ncbi:MAG TPA: MTH1187 family thiamine-binding protein [Nitrososphaeraceae archaeon]|nr:MTH1187 family thiamine-binding protein [Nitrososphaeraceae archaeon]
MNNNNNEQTIHAEISILPIGTSNTSISKEVAAAFDAIRKTKDIKTANLTPMGTQIEANNMQAILRSIEAAHEALKSSGVKRIVSSIRIAERLDASRTLDDEVKSVTERLSG